MTENKTLTAKQKRAITALLTERTTRDAAKAAKVSESTLWRWLDDSEFKAELTRQEGAVLDEVTRGLLTMQGAALEELRDLINGPAPAGIRLQAVKAALELQLKYRELNSLEERIRKLEEVQNVKH